jgi:hypothetical protein
MSKCLFLYCTKCIRIILLKLCVSFFLDSHGLLWQKFCFVSAWSGFVRILLIILLVMAAAGGSLIFLRIVHLCGVSALSVLTLTRGFLCTGERPFHCTLCEKAFNQKSALQVHMKKHTGERPYRCDYCVMGFTQKSNMKLHMKRAHSFVGEPCPTQPCMGWQRLPATLRCYFLCLAQWLCIVHGTTAVSRRRRLSLERP